MFNGFFDKTSLPQLKKRGVLAETLFNKNKGLPYCLKKIQYGLR
jgi:hypothetical protein